MDASFLSLRNLEIACSVTFVTDRHVSGSQLCHQDSDFVLMDIIGYLASVLIGISLGLIGGGGSILTVPVLVYIFGISPVISTSYSLFIVGSTSLVGAYTNYQRGLVNIKTALLFGMISTGAVYLTRRLVIPVIPDELFMVGGFELTQRLLTMVLFAVLMLAASTGMISGRQTRPLCLECRPTRNVLKLVVSAIGIGLITGLLGAGGGFLLIPTLVLVLGMPMREAVGTSLLIIALNSLVGFAGDLGHFAINWYLLLTITLVAVAGIFIGGLLSGKLDSGQLKKGFGWFVLLMGCLILLKELFL